MNNPYETTCAFCGAKVLCIGAYAHPVILDAGSETGRYVVLLGDNAVAVMMPTYALHYDSCPDGKLGEC